MCLTDKLKTSFIKKQLVASVSAELSIWDKALCEALCSTKMAALFHPDSLLIDYGKKLGWEKRVAEANPPGLREFGAVSDIEQKKERHSAYCALVGDFETIRNRIWRGTVSVLFPLIELRRQELLRRYQLVFDLPQIAPDGNVINDVFDLDWGNICYQLHEKRGSLPKGLLSTAMALRDARNALAHNNLLPLELIQSGLLEIPIGDE